MTNPTPAGWHSDPTDPNLMRYWDGQQWTAQTQPKAPPVVEDDSEIHPFDASIHTYSMVNKVMSALAMISLILFVVLLLAESMLSWAALVACVVFLVVGFIAAKTGNRMWRQAYGDRA
ncbi:DUF2510 domain-containing protein [Rhodococcus qingshengii]|uniref:DUF2510 domain-containing protein n=1 Tax=Rhodococcus qingshengii TaxID=334542 RepID=UPI002AFE66C1|nr:DUF2510 domain-containing protein [Rhodococcus qingshengii]MEA1798564.1 DUF2510 domain-containing protein [Rhodococcus qingshengii]